MVNNSLKMVLLVLVLLLCGCAVGVTYHYDSDGKVIQKDPHFSLMQIPVVPDHSTAQSTVGLGFSVRFTDIGGAITPKVDVGYFRHAIGINPVIDDGKKLGSVAIATSADVTGDGIQDEVDFGEASLVQHFNEDTNPSMLEAVIQELTAMKESADGVEKVKYQNAIDFLKAVLGGE